MIDIQDYLTHMAVGLTSKKTIEEAKWGKIKKNTYRILEPLKLEEPLFHIEEDDLP